MDGESFRSQEWPPGYRFETVYFIVFVFGVLWLVPSAQGTTGTELLWFLAMFLCVLISRELAEFWVMRAFGARPKFRPRLQFKPALNSWMLAENHRFTGRQFAAVGLIPVLLAVVVGALFLLLTPARESGMLLMAVYLLAEGRTIWLSVAALLRPPGTLFEQRREATFVHEPLQHSP